MNYLRKAVLLFTLMIWGARCEIAGSKKPLYHPLNTRHSDEGTFVQKVTLTQKGYIQFLKYMTEVPDLTEFTFCIWLRSKNFTHSHPLLSYSKNEGERLIRVWVSNGGSFVNMAIKEKEVFRVHLGMHENHWYHICPSWNSKKGTWYLYFNGKLRDSGVKMKLKDVIIEKGGDLVVGQEYTDFDKGLDDGIEGDIYGFNMILSSVQSEKTNPPDRRRQIYIPTVFADPTLSSQLQPPPNISAEVPEVLAYFTAAPSRVPKGVMLDLLNKFSDLFETGNPRKRMDHRKINTWRGSNFGPRPMKRLSKNEIDPISTKRLPQQQLPKSLGLVLVELSYGNCALGRGAPIKDNKVLVSWTKTPVRVFGGAILKTIKPFCK